MPPTSSFDRPVRALLASPVHTIPETASADQAVASLRALEISSLLVLGASGDGVGVISRTDLLHGAGDTVRERMTRGVVSVDVDDTIAAAAREMTSRAIHRVYVFENGVPVGVLSTREIALAVRDAKAGTPLASIMSSPVRTVSFDAPVEEATALLGTAAIGALVVVDNDHPVGLFTQREALAARWVPPGTAVDEVMSPALLCLRTTVPAFRAAAFTVSTRARRIVVVHEHWMKGIVSGMDFAWLVASSGGGPPDGWPAERFGESVA